MIKHIFIINPTAGKGFEAEELAEAIKDACDACGINYEIHMTVNKDDAKNFTYKCAMSKPPEDEYRFYACGGDGTLSNVISGLVSESSKVPLDKICVGCMPTGTGNDFARNFSQSEFFVDITKQLLADQIVIDCFKISGDTPECERYGINMVNVGFDCEVVCKASELKRNRRVPKGLAYILGIISVLKRNPGQKMIVTTSDGDKISREFQLVAVANGGYCGGGFNSAPKAKLDDGLLDLSLIKKVTRFTFLRLVGKYKKGTHLKSRLGKKVVSYRQLHSVELKFPTDTNVCVDGEIFKATELKITVLPNAVRFLLPVGTVKKI